MVFLAIVNFANNYSPDNSLIFAFLPYGTPRGSQSILTCHGIRISTVFSHLLSCTWPFSHWSLKQTQSHSEQVLYTSNEDCVLFTAFFYLRSVSVYFVHYCSLNLRVDVHGFFSVLKGIQKVSLFVYCSFLPSSYSLSLFFFSLRTY